MSGYKGKNKDRRKRIVNLEVDELSPVDKPAIGEGFFIIKRADGSTDDEATKEAMIKGSHWLTKNKSDISKVGVCHFCKEEGGREPKIGLRCGVCFSCAVERQEKGVFDECLEGSFDIESYREKYGEESMSKSDENTEKDDEKSKVDQPENEEEKKPEDESQEASGDSEAGEKSDEEKEEADESSSGDSQEEEEKPDESQKSESTQKAHKVITKQFEELKGLLEQSLALHEDAARALNAMMEMQVMALEQVAMLTDGQDEQSEEQEAEVASASGLTEIFEEIKNFKADVSKAGAKISQSRLRVLQEIADKLSDLLRSVNEQKKDGKKRRKNKSEGLVSRIKSLESSIEAIRKEATEKMGDLANKINDLENTAGASGAIDDETDVGEVKQKSKNDSIFADLIGLDEINHSIQKRKAYLEGGGESS